MPPSTEYLPPVSHQKLIFRQKLILVALLNATQAILPTTQNNFDWAAGQLQGHGKTQDNPGMLKR